jgi:hypothetical protein
MNEAAVFVGLPLAVPMMMMMMRAGAPARPRMSAQPARA